MKRGLDTYRRLRSPFPVVCIFSVAIGGLIVVAAAWNFRLLPNDMLTFDTHEKLDRLTFLLYSSIYAAIWLAYFFSKSEKLTFFRRRSLRMLLVCTSENWKEADEQILDDENLQGENPSLDFPFKTLARNRYEITAAKIEETFRDKARSATQNLGMLLAIACLELAQINLITKGLQVTDEWTKLTLGIATLASITAFVMFIVATDSLDTVFNQFRIPADRHRLVNHFYRSSINPKYYGLTLLILSAVMIIGNREPLLGASAFGIVFAVGYHHWFPRIDCEAPIEGEDKANHTLAVMTKLTIVSIPLVQLFFTP